MKTTLQEIIRWGLPLIIFSLIVFSAGRKSFPGKLWLIGFLGTQLLTIIGWNIPNLLGGINSIKFNRSRFFDVYALPLDILGFAGFCLMFPAVLAVSSNSRGNLAPGIHKEKLGDEDNRDSADETQPHMSTTSVNTNNSNKRNGWIMLGIMFVVAYINATSHFQGYAQYVIDIFQTGCLIGSIVFFATAPSVKNPKK